MAKEYRTNGSAAYDIRYTARNQNTARPLERPERLPDAPVRRQPVQKVKARVAVSPFAIVGTAVALVMLFLVLFSYVRMFEAKSDVGRLTSQLSELNTQNERLQSQYANALDMEAVETRAKELGMRQPGPSQIVYVHVSGGDTTEVYSAPEQRGFFAEIYDAFRSVFTDALEYFA